MFAVALVALGVIVLVLVLANVALSLHAALILLGVVAILAGLSQMTDVVARFRQPNG